jgi:hypothetical protein
MCFVIIWEQTATCATYSINWLVFITEMKSVYCAVRTGSLNIAVWASSLKNNVEVQQCSSAYCPLFLVQVDTRNCKIPRFLSASLCELQIFFRGFTKWEKCLTLAYLKSCCIAGSCIWMKLSLNSTKYKQILFNTM